MSLLTKSCLQKAVVPHHPNSLGSFPTPTRSLGLNCLIHTLSSSLD